MAVNFLNKFQNKLIIILSLGIVVPTAIVGGYSVTSSSNALINLVSTQMETETDHNADSIKLFLNGIKADVLYLSQTPPIQGIVRARDNKGIDPLDKSTYQSWVTRLNIIFFSFIEYRNYYYKIRFLDESGKELVRVNNKNGKFEIVPSSGLQSKSDQEFQTAMQLPKGEVYVSQINLNREGGVIETPYVSVIRYATPIYSANGQRKGIIIANVLAEDIFKFAKRKDVDKQTAEEFFAINSQGYYINHQNKDKLWGFVLNKENETVKKDYPDISGEILSKENGLINEQKNIISYRQITTMEKQP
jgi:methyl-accepting chemotaxis protein